MCVHVIKSFLLLEGCVEIWLTSEDLGAYGIDIGVTLPQLLWQLVDTIPEGARMRLGMTNPPYILEHLEVIYLIFISHIHIQCHIGFLRADLRLVSDGQLM